MKTKRSIRRALCVVLAVVLYSSALVYAQAPTLTNPSFETGDSTGWTCATGCEVNDVNSHSGTYRAQILSTREIEQSVGGALTACPDGISVTLWTVGTTGAASRLTAGFSGSTAETLDIVQSDTGIYQEETLDVESDGSSGETFTINLTNTGSPAVASDDYSLTCLNMPTPTPTATITPTPTATNTLAPFPTIPHDTGQTSGGDEFIVYRTTTYGDLAVFAGVMGVFVTVLLSLMLTILDRARPRQE